VARAANVTYLTMQVQVRQGDTDVRAMVVGFEPGQPGEPGYLVAGRHITRSHYEAVADVAPGFQLGERIRIRRHDYTVVGLTRRMVSSGGDPMVFIPLKDAQEAQFLKDNDAIVNERARTAANPALNRPGVPGLLEAVQASQASNRNVNAVLVQVQRRRAMDPEAVAEPDPPLEAPAGLHPRADGRDPGRQADRHLGQADRHVPGDPGHRQRGHRGLHHLHDDAGQDPRDRGAQADRHAQPHHRRDDPAAGAGLGLIGFIVGKVAATFWAPIFPEVRAAGSPATPCAVSSRDGDLRAGQHAGHPRGAEGRPGGGDRG
jgi:putative ABC transport system permease protein